MNPARIDRALSVLGYLAHHHEGRSLTHLSADLSLPMSSTHDLMQALVEIGVVRLAGPRTYALGPRAVMLALSIVDSVQLRAVARPFLRDLSEEINENTYLAVRTGDEVAYADRIETSQQLSVIIRLGDARPLHGSAVGKLMAAFDDELAKRVLSSSRLEQYTPLTLTNRATLRAEYAEIRERGYSVSDGESVEGIIGLATPIVNANGEAVAAVHVSAPRGRLAEDRLPVVVSHMLATAAAVSRQLGASAELIPDSDFNTVLAHEKRRRGAAS
ncbi:IclR family transcriptional regulator [Amycolatopsis deserti]|uniref:IclR family transcriptional regulator n=1 Tax=Amycolatopsis deserti TaxID=185696 RepID=A0ABQ3JF77_9PSEU|nr:IclR family transcriptional regulator [Amycolatopsis deserti]GHF18742.1 IclR family transcriptional regulator [Amycolatopsis deserti]